MAAGVAVTLFLFCLLSVVGSSLGETCSRYEYDSSHRSSKTYFECDYECCGDRCCSSSDHLDVILKIVIIVPTVIGILIIVSIAICCYCCLKKSRGHQGRVVYHNSAQVSIVNTESTAANSAYPHGTMFPPQTSLAMAPPAYNTVVDNPPPYPGLPTDQNKTPGTVNPAFTGDK